ncbi:MULTISPECIES: nucleoside-diphosphate sugar epimerase/dehydratase [unclassified Psychrobacter]|uniref:polysaccharide biosynthesis protein n=1 Tax=unclassified Psychrobacter TaxID=196806 RepID=UPI0025B5E679|nr:MULTISPECIES: nucleoside-diphosphate sugar epimerase/dehydratase [unclassified Psychrobacter]MDN3453867.1 nucleoside-diphosphate sugar epimerase/dehydratase [Psychrobacter sp. APC 3350]MDN3502059.1 nucleoside-diphosphate sugar epimerase/dehydratase [Psychrobacter sp. 5A.1]
MSIQSNENDSYRSSHSNQHQQAKAKKSWLYGRAQQLLSLPRMVKRIILMSADLLMSMLCLYLALALRYGYMANHISPAALFFYAIIPVIGLFAIGFYKGVSRVFFDAVMRQVLQLFVLLILAYQLIIFLDWLPTIPRSTPIIYLFLLFIWLWNSRLTIKELLARWQGKPHSRSKRYGQYENIIIYGAGAAGKELFEALHYSHKYHIVGFIDDNTQLSGAHFAGKKIYHASELLEVVKHLKVAQVFLALPSVSLTHRRQIIDKLADVSVKIKQLPSLQEIADEKVTVSTMRQVNILDVLNRQTVEPEQHLLQQNITGKCVLVTGAGGSIGSELCRQIIKNQPHCLVLYELSEYALYSIHQELIATVASKECYAGIEVIAVIGNVTNEANLTRVLNDYSIQTVYHAAAYKHVPIVEHNPFEGVINNTKGTYHCARAAIAANVETFVLISTDKAVRPTNVMGASKRLAELVCQGLSQELSQTSDRQTRISMVRFGNVLGSSGSVVPLFTKQIEQGKPITVTHPDVTRYFMTIPEAANLVIQAGAMARGGEVFVLDMGAPVKIVDLARRMIHLSGYETKDGDHPNGDIEIVFTGLRPGEKLYEELIIGEDNVQKTSHPLIMQAMEHCFPLMDIEETLSQLVDKAEDHDVTWLKQQFKVYVEGYKSN